MQKRKVCDLDVSKTHKKILGLLVKPQNLFSVAAKLNLHYQTIYLNTRILQEKGFVLKITSPSGKILFQTNTGVLEL